MLVQRMGAGAVDAEAVEGGRQAGGEIAVAAAAGKRVLEVDPKLGGEAAGVLVERGDGIRFLVGGPVEAAGDLELDRRVMGLEGADPRDQRLAGFRCGHAKVDLGPAGLGHHIDPGAALDQAHIDGEAALVIGHRLDLDDLARHLEDRAFAVLVAHTGMGGLAAGGQGHAARPLAGGDAFTAVPRRLDHQDVFGLFGRRLDERARGGAADLLVGTQQELQRQRGLAPVGDQAADGGEGDKDAAFHVVDAWAIGAVALGPDRVARQGAGGVDGVEMAEDQDAGRFAAPGSGGPEVVALAVAAGDALGPQAGGGEVGLGGIHHRGQARQIPRLALDRDPAVDAVEEGLGVGIRVWVRHGGGPWMVSAARRLAWGWPQLGSELGWRQAGAVRPGGCFGAVVFGARNAAEQGNPLIEHSLARPEDDNDHRKPVPGWLAALDPVSGSGGPGARPELQQIPASAGRGRAAGHRVPLGRGAGLVRRRALSAVERHSQ